MTERSLILIKPDGVQRGLTGQILARIEAKGYQLVELKMLTATTEILSEHYAEHRDKPFYQPLVDFMLSGPVVAAIFEGDRVVEGIRTIMGPSEPTTAPAGTIRADLGRSWGQGVQKNLVHGSDSPQSAQREIAIWFAD
ncbi:MAG: nucleoside-diphosphate kinase [Rothia sp. (in: high G+C Gram-positive bacteria)]|nr:nucleoside-diphosphate kinase [Rothia sp. (in: high G+C Gram-positive bacteria)]